MDVVLHASLTGGVSLARSGIVPTGRGFPSKKPSKNLEEADVGEVNLNLLPTNQSSNDNFGAHCITKPEKQGQCKE